MIIRVLWVGVIAGLIAGAIVTAVQLTQLVPLIQIAEEYETAAIHEHHDHEAAVADPSASAAMPHEHEWEPEGLQRRALTAAANVLVGVGYGLLLVAGMTLAGRPTDKRTGLLWGLAGFIVFAGAPALGLPPELPGMPAAELGARQLWWLGTAAGTAAGIVAIAFGPAKLKALGVLLLLAPHVIGAPHLESEVAGTGVPAEVAAQFVAASLVSALLFWLALGASAGHLLGRRVAAD
jgi:cobalt transporter subunit CbtA